MSDIFFGPYSESTDASSSGNNLPSLNRTNSFPKVVLPLSTKWAEERGMMSRPAKKTGASTLQTLSKSSSEVSPEFIFKYNKSSLVLVKIRENYFVFEYKVLMSFTKYFDKCMCKDYVELPPEKVTSKGLIIIYKWMLNRRTLTQESFIENADCVDFLHVMKIAVFLLIDPVITWCCTRLEDERIYNEYKAYLLLIEARALKMDDVCDLMLQRISKCFLAIIASDEFLKLKSSDVARLFSLSIIAVHSEIEVFYAGVVWLMADWPRRKRNVKEVLSCVRYIFLPAWFLVSLFVRPDPEKISEILNEDINRLIYDAMVYRPGEPKNRKKIPKERLWIYDGICPYYDENSIHPDLNLNFDLFKSYMQSLNADKGRTRWMLLKVAKREYFEWRPKQ